MANFRDSRYINGIDTDTDGVRLPFDKVRDAVSVRMGTTDKGVDTSGENVKGNTLIPNSYLPLGYNQTIGAAEDKLNRRTVYFNFNSKGNHGIYLWDKSTNTIEQLMEWSGLNFDINHPIQADVVNGEMVYWNDALNVPRKLNIERARTENKYLVFNIYITRDQREVFKTAQTLSIQITTNNYSASATVYTAASDVNLTYGYDRDATNFRNGLLAIKTGIEASSLMTNIIDTVELVGQHLKVTLKDAGYAVIDTFTSTTPGASIPTGASSTWVYYAYDNMYERPYIDQYIEREITPFVKQLDTTIYENVFSPVARWQTYIDGKTELMYKKPRFNISAITVDGESSTYNTLCPHNGTLTYEVYRRLNNTTIDKSIGILIQLGNDKFWDLTDSKKLSILNNLSLSIYDEDTNVLVELKKLTVEDVSGIEIDGYMYVGENGIRTLSEEKLTEYNQSTPKLAHSQVYMQNRLWESGIEENYESVEIDCSFDLNYMSITDYQTLTPLFNGQRKESFNSYGWSGQYGIVYLDGKGKRSPVCTNISLQWHTPYPGQSGASFGSFPVIKLNINSLPPIWAKYYGIVRTKNRDASNNWTLPVVAVEYLDKDGTVTAFGSGNEAFVKIYTDIDRVNRLTSSEFVYLDGESYARFPYIASGGAGSYYESKIVQIIDNGIVIPYTSSWPEIQGISTLYRCFIEVFNKPNNTDDDLFYETGMIFDIIESGGIKYHSGDYQDQTSSLPAICYIEPDAFFMTDNDVDYAYRKITGVGALNGDNRPMQNLFANRYTGTISNNYNRPQVVNYDQKQKLYNTLVRWTDEYVADGYVNGLSTNKGLDFLRIDDSYGLISVLQSDGATLVALGSNGMSGSIYVNESVLKTTTGGDINVKSSDVASEERNYKGGLGTSHRLGAAKDNYGNMYFLDSLNGIAVRRSVSGLEPISQQYNNNVYWKGISGQETMEGRDVNLAVYDREFAEVILFNGFEVEATAQYTPDQDWPEPRLTLVTNLDKVELWEGNVEILIEDSGKYAIANVESIDFDNNQIIVSSYNDIDGILVDFTTYNIIIRCLDNKGFNINNNIWTSRYPFNPEMVCTIGNSFVSFKNGNLYTHNTNDVYNNFYGVQHTRKIKLEAGSQPDGNGRAMKDWLKMQIQGTGSFAVPEIENEKGQASNLIDTDFEEIEGVFYADFLLDTNTPNVSNPLIEGDSLKSETLTLEIEDDSTDYSVVKQVDVYYNLSQSTNK